MSSLLRPEETARWYEEKVRKYGYDHRGLGFRNRSSQEKRFEALLGLGDFQGRRVLDVGCGFGDLLEFFMHRGIRPVYTGLDVCKPMIQRCQERFQGDVAHFICADVLEHTPEQQFDYVVASGLFGLDAEGARERIRPTLEKLFGWSRIGTAVNFLSTNYPRPVEGRIYVEPGKALEAALELTPAVRLDHSYLPNDFTLHLYKTPAWEAA
jgi:SAM-dependent methyltransferase